MEVIKVGRWFALALLLGFVVFDLCGNTPPKPLPEQAEVSRAAGTAGGEAVTFDVLAGFPAPWPEPGQPFVAPKIPADVKALDGRQVTIAGYIVPLEITGENRTKSFLLCRYAQGCCFGGVPQPGELIAVETEDDDGVAAVTHAPTIFTGVLRINEPRSAEDLVIGLYRLEDARVVEQRAAEHQ